MNHCSACGLPPLLGQRLHQCSRCKSAWYHDSHCQKCHYKQHKKECLRLSQLTRSRISDRSTVDATITAFNDLDVQNVANKIQCKQLLVECRITERKGRSLVAIINITMGCRPMTPLADTVDEEGRCLPLVPPLLIESMRDSRCAYCFRSLDTAYNQPQPNCVPILYHHCSKACQNKDDNHILESLAVKEIYNLYPMDKLPTPTVILCSRILRYSEASPAVAKQFRELCCNIYDLSEKEKEDFLLIMTQCSVFLRCLPLNPINNAAYKACCDMINPDPTPAYEFMSRITLNGFTISTALIPIGVGIYPAASMINHSCRPNSVPSIILPYLPHNSTPTPPTLQITTCQTIPAGEEITISYCDTSSPRHIRRKELWEGYKFECDCTWCQNTQIDSEIVGLKCPNQRCGGNVGICQPLPSRLPPPLLDRPTFQCSSCGYSKFDPASSTLERSLQVIEEIESKMRTNSFPSDSTTNKERLEMELSNIYDELKNICQLQTSWYIAWSADALVNWLACSLKWYNDEQVQLEVCLRALKVANESQAATRFCMEYPGNLRWYILRGVEAKLRLFVHPTDTEALDIARGVKRVFLQYYPHNDEFIRALEGSIGFY